MLDKFVGMPVTLHTSPISLMSGRTDTEDQCLNTRLLKRGMRQSQHADAYYPEQEELHIGATVTWLISAAHCACVAHVPRLRVVYCVMHHAFDSRRCAAAHV